MPYPDLDYSLTEEQTAMRDMVRRFGAEVVRPGGIALDRLPDPQQVIDEDSLLWDMIGQYRDLGLHKTGFSKALGGTAEDMDPMMHYLISEEMAYADVGFALSMGAGGMFFNMCQLVPIPEMQQLVREYIEDPKSRLVGCWGIIEPEHGSDWMLGRDNPDISPSVTAELKGDEYVINGQKAAWVTNGTIATHCVLHAGMDRSQGMAGQGILLVPLDLPGVSKGKPLDKLGQRALNQGEVFFDEVHVPKEFLLVPPGAMALGGGGGGGGQTPMSGMAVAFGGLAKAALDEAIAYAKQRVQVGKPIIEHQNVSLKLFEMFMQVESARSLARRLYLYNAESGATTAMHSMAGKWMSTETAFKVASTAIQIFGGNGLSKEYCIEKIFRDARTGMIEDGVNETLALGVVDQF